MDFKNQENLETDCDLYILFRIKFINRPLK